MVALKAPLSLLGIFEASESQAFMSCRTTNPSARAKEISKPSIMHGDPSPARRTIQAKYGEGEFHLSSSLRQMF